MTATIQTTTADLYPAELAAYNNAIAARDAAGALAAASKLEAAYAAENEADRKAGPTGGMERGYSPYTRERFWAHKATLCRNALKPRKVARPDCPRCGGTGKVSIPTTLAHGDCFLCFGRGR